MLNKLHFLTLIAAIIFIVVDSNLLYAQQKEMTIDISSHQRPDTIYAQPKNANVAIDESMPNDRSEVATPQDVNPQIMMILDSLKKEVSQLKSQAISNRDVIAGMQSNLTTSHKKFKLGTILLLGGYLAYNLGALSLQASTTASPAGPGTVFLVLGGFGSSITGLVFLIRSHKYIGKAGSVTSFRRAYNYK
jgi:hypothetical protein